jgi:hypothetical protein
LQPVFTALRQPVGNLHFHAQAFGIPASRMNQRAANLLFQILAEEPPGINNASALLHAAQPHAQQVVRKDLHTARAVALLANLIEHRQPDLGEFRRLLRIWRSGQGRFK